MSGASSPRPAWWTPAMPEAEVRIWEAAERTASTAPELTPADDVYLRLRPLLAGLLAKPANQGRDAA